MREGKRDGRALASTVALGAVFIDLLLSRTRVEVRHPYYTCTMFVLVEHSGVTRSIFNAQNDDGLLEVAWTKVVFLSVPLGPIFESRTD